MIRLRANGRRPSGWRRQVRAVAVGAAVGLATYAAMTFGSYANLLLRVVAVVVALAVPAFLAWLAEIRSASPPAPQQIIQLQNC